MSDSENTYTTYITHISITCIAHISYIIFQAYEKTVKYFLKFFFLYIKMSSKCYQKYNENLQKEATERYQNVSEEEKDKRQKRTQERY